MSHQAPGKSGVTSSIGASEQSVVTCSWVRADPKAIGWEVLGINPLGVTQRDFLFDPFEAALESGGAASVDQDPQATFVRAVEGL